jgi:hypothetical protein
VVLVFFREQRVGVQKDVFTPGVRGNEAVSPNFIEPQYLSCRHSSRILLVIAVREVDDNSGPASRPFAPGTLFQITECLVRTVERTRRENLEITREYRSG